MRKYWPASFRNRRKKRTVLFPTVSLLCYCAVILARVAMTFPFLGRAHRVLFWCRWLFEHFCYTEIRSIHHAQIWCLLLWFLLSWVKSEDASSWEKFFYMLGMRVSTRHSIVRKLLIWFGRCKFTLPDFPRRGLWIRGCSEIVWLSEESAAISE